MGPNSGRLNHPPSKQSTLGRNATFFENHDGNPRSIVSSRSI